MKSARFVVLGIILCLNFSLLLSQSRSSSIIKPVGIGLHLEQFKVIDFSDFLDFPANKIAVMISPSNSFRFESEFGVRSGKYETTSIKSKGSSVSVGLGTFGMIQKNKLNLYGGLRFEYGEMKSTEEIMNNSVTDKTSRLMLGPVVGAEYYLGENFTFGGEVGLKFVSLKSTKDPKPTGYEDEEGTYAATDTGLFIRFYF
jgi:hypothetical protein